MVAISVSDKGLAHTGGFEGRVLRYYKDAGGMGTIGDGFTWLSATFRNWWLAHKGHKLRPGDTMTVAECKEVFALIARTEYAPHVRKRFGDNLEQHQFDAAFDTDYNCGPRCLTWGWALELARGAVAAAAEKLRVTAVTAGGKKLAGLVRRREAAARLLSSGIYAVHIPGVRPDHFADLSRIQALGFATVEDFQRANDLTVDGVIGTATKSTIKRVEESRAAVKLTAGGGSAGGAVTGTSQVQSFDWHALVTVAEWAIVAAVIVFVLFLIWRNRGVILRRRTAA